MALIPPLMTFATRLQFVDVPSEQRKIHSGSVPKVGGIAFAVGTFLTMLVWVPKEEVVTSVLLGGLIILGFGMWDDRVNLPYSLKILGQMAAGLIVLWYGRVILTSVPFVDDEIAFALGAPLTLVIVVGVTNAINLADGLDGLAGGLSLISFAGMACLAYLIEDHLVMWLMVPILGALLGFLRFNTYPARIFMGDAGSQFLGFYLALSAIVLTDSYRGPYTPSLVLFLLGVPPLDTLGVMLQRIKEGRSPFVADRNHVHHKLLSAGFSHYEAVLIIYLLHGGMVALAYVLRWQSDLVVWSIYLGIAACILALFVCPIRTVADASPISQLRARLLESVSSLSTYSWLTKEPIRLLGMAVPAFLICSVFLPTHVPEEMGLWAVALFGVVLGGLWLVPATAPLLVRAGLYVGSTFVMYLIEQLPMTSTVWSPLHLLFLFLASLVVLTIRFNAEHRFQTTPLDYLTVFLALLIPMLPELHVHELSLSLLIAKLIVLFFSFELLLHTFSQRLTQLGLVSLWLLFAISIRAWW